MTLECKICGVSNSKILKFIINHRFPPQFIGFIVNYPKSKRYVELNKLKELIKIDKNKSQFVAVLVKPNEDILEKIKEHETGVNVIENFLTKNECNELLVYFRNLKNKPY